MRILIILLAAAASACASSAGSNDAGGSSGPGGGGGGPGQPFALAEAEAPFSLALQADNVVWTDVHWEQSVRTSVVNRVPKSGGTPARVAEHGGDDLFFYGIAADQSNVHWVGYGQSTPGGLFAAPSSGLDPVVVAANQGAPLALTRDAQGLYWINLSPGAAMGLPNASTSPITLATDPQDSATCVAVAGSDIVWLSHNGTSRISRVGRAGGASAVVTEGSNGGSIMCLAADATDVYFTRGGTSTGDFEPVYNHDGAVYRVPVAGGPEALLAGGQEHPHGIALRDDYVYWLSGDGALQRMLKMGGTIETLVPPTGATDAPRTQTVVADASGVYWISNSKIWALPLP